MLCYRVETPRARWIRRLTADEAIAKYTGRRRGIYERAKESLLLWGIGELDFLIKPFVKAEKLDLSAKENPVPRIISPADPRYNLELSRYLQHLEHELYRAIRKLFGEHTVFKGLNALQAGRLMHKKWSKFRRPCAVGLDCSRFDLHVRVEMLKFEHSIYKLFYDGDSYLAWLLRAQLYSKCVAHTRDGGVRYRTNGGRCSGHPNTALGNCLIMCALVWVYCHNNDIPIEFCDNGDDGCVILETEYLPKLTKGLSAWFLDHGFELKIEAAVFELERIDFCQTSPVWTPDGYMMVRNPLKGLSKDQISFDNITDETQWRQACRLIGECGMHLAGHMPMYCALYRKMVDIGGEIPLKNIEVERCGMWWLSRGLDYSGRPVHEETRFSFWKAFGVIPDVQREWELSMERREVHYEPTRSGHMNCHLLSESVVLCD